MISRMSIQVVHWTKEHLLPIVFAFLIGFVIIAVAKTKLNLKQKRLLFNILGCFVSLTVIVYHIYIAVTIDYDVSRDLPLFLCSFMALIIPLFTYFRKFWMYEILVFWIFAGTTQAIITPDISNAFPDLEYFRYWIVHLGLVVIILYAIIVFGMRPKFKSVFKSIIALQAYVIVVFLINILLGSNYSYLTKKPNAASILDYLGDWPFYIIITELFIIPYFLIIYLPFYLLGKKQRSI